MRLRKFSICWFLSHLVGNSYVPLHSMLFQAFLYCSMSLHAHACPNMSIPRPSMFIHIHWLPIHAHLLPSMPIHAHAPQCPSIIYHYSIRNFYGRAFVFMYNNLEKRPPYINVSPQHCATRNGSNAQNLLENWVGKQSFFCFDIDNGLKKIFFCNKTFLFFKIESWNFQVHFEI